LATIAAEAEGPGGRAVMFLPQPMSNTALVINKM
jgi:hypothetical protein